MKKILSLLFMIVFAVVAMAQERTVSIDIKQGFNWGTYVEYTGTAADTLTANQDSIDYEFTYKKEDYVNKVVYSFELDTIAAADTLTVELLGYDFDDDPTPTSIISAATVNLAGETVYINKYDYATAAKELSYRKYGLRVLRTGTGEGVDINKVTFKIYN